MAYNILGFKLSGQGIGIPLINITIPFAFILLATGSITSSARASKFPPGGTFKDQQDYLDTLPFGCPQDTTKTVNSLITAPNPFVHLTNMPADITAEVYRHEYDSTYGVVTRRIAANTPQLDGTHHIAEQEQLFIGGEGDGSSPLTFVFERTPEGNLKPIKKEKIPVSEYAAGIQEANNNEGLVVSVKTEEAHCYQSLRPK